MLPHALEGWGGYGVQVGPVSPLLTSCWSSRPAHVAPAQDAQLLDASFGNSDVSLSHFGGTSTSSLQTDILVPA